MEALNYLMDQGFIVRTVGDRLSVAPAARLTDELRQWIRQHKPELLEQARCYRCWRISRDGMPLATMIGAACNRVDALDYARFHWPDAEIVPHEHGG